MLGFLRFESLGQVVAALVAVLTLSQCALPPGTAWTVIRKDGVKDYFAISWGKKPVPEYVKELVPEAFGLPAAEAEDSENEVVEGEGGAVAHSDAFPDVPGVMPEDWARPVEPVFPLMSTNPPELTSGDTAPVGAQVVGVNPLLGGVGNDEFAKVSLPEVVPASTVGEVEREKGGAPGLKMKDPVVSSSTTEMANHLAEGLGEELKKGESAEPMMGPPFIGEAKALAEVATPKEEVTRVVSDDAKVDKFLPTMVPGSVTEEVPFGLLVEGRPGYVRSPFADSHQIVDVTGLKVGASVKCPFSGKFFRVPAAHAAMNESVKAEGPGGRLSAEKSE